MLKPIPLILRTPDQKRIRLVKRVMGVGAIGMLLILGLVLFSDGLVERVAVDRVYHQVLDVPAHRVALVLGCSRYLPYGGQNPFFRKRIACVVELYKAGKVKFIIVSGDNSRKDYDEPTDMRQALVERGVPDAVIFSDYAGFNTLDSIVRAKKVFGQNRLVVISQEFHIKRAIYIGENNGMDMVGMSAEDVVGRAGLRTHLREYLARVKTVLDIHVFHRSPHFLGEPVLVAERT